MSSLLDLPTEIIAEISQNLPLKSAVFFSCANRQLYNVLEYTRLGVPQNPGILAMAIRNQRDPAAIKHLFDQIAPVVGLASMLGVLSVAFQCQNTEALEVLWGESCFNIYQGNTRPRCAGIFFDAVFQSHKSAVGKFIELWPNSLGSALVGAAAGGSVATARFLIKNGMDVNTTGPENTFNGSLEWYRMCKELAVAEDDRLWLTPLACAAAKGHLEMVRLLVQHKAVVEVRDNIGNTPLCWAARQDTPPLEDSAISVAIEKHDIGMFRLLLEQLAFGHQILPDLLLKAETIVSDLLRRVNVTELHPMMLAYAARSEPIFQKLLGADVNRAALSELTQYSIINGLVYWTPIFSLKTILECASFGGKRMFQFLLEQHRWDEQLSPHGPNAEIAIRLAIATGDLDLLQTLFELGFPHASKHKLLVLAASNVRDGPAPGQIIDFLLKEDQRELRELDSDGKSVLFELMSVNTAEGCLNHRAAVQLLLDRGANPLQRNLNGDTPLEEAARKGHRYESFWLMLEYLQKRDDWHVIGQRVVQLNQVMKKNYELRRILKKAERTVSRSGDLISENEWIEGVELLTTARIGAYMGLWRPQTI